MNDQNFISQRALSHRSTILLVAGLTGSMVFSLHKLIWNDNGCGAKGAHFIAGESHRIGVRAYISRGDEAAQVNHKISRGLEALIRSTKLWKEGLHFDLSGIRPRGFPAERNGVVHREIK